jgi:hypothetical protein
VAQRHGIKLWYKTTALSVASPPMKHLGIRWNPDLQEWFCVRCGRTSDHVVREDAQVEMEAFECEIPTTEPRRSLPCKR